MVICSRLWLCAILSVLSRALGFSRPQVMSCFDITSYMIVQRLKCLKRSNGHEFLILLLSLSHCIDRKTSDQHACVSKTTTEKCNSRSKMFNVYFGVFVKILGASWYDIIKHPFAVNWSRFASRSNNKFLFWLSVNHQPQHHHKPLTLFAFKSVDLHLVTVPQRALLSGLSGRENLLHSLPCFNSVEMVVFIAIN